MLESGARLARIDTLVKLSTALGLETGSLLEGIEWTTTSWASGEFRIASLTEDS
jgi:hypothetical protein